MNAIDHRKERPCRTKPIDEYAFVTYTEEPNLFSVVLLKRVTGIDSLNYGLLRDNGKPHRVHIERKGKSSQATHRRRITSILGSLAEMEGLSKTMHTTSTYGMREDVVSDCEEWSSRYNRKAAASTNEDDDRNGKNVYPISPV